MLTAVHVRGVCTHVYVDTVTHRLDEDDMCPALSLYLIPLRQGLLLNLELVWRAITPSPPLGNHPVSSLSFPKHRHSLNSRGNRDVNSDPLRACTASTLTC